MRIYHQFPNYDRAVGFAQGVEYANDSALQVLGIYRNPTPIAAGTEFVVAVEDEDAEGGTSELPQEALVPVASWSVDVHSL